MHQRATHYLDAFALKICQRLQPFVAILHFHRDVLQALADLKRKGVEIMSGPLVHGPESQSWNIGGSGTRSFYFLDPNGNSLEIYCDMMKVPNGE